MNYDNYILSIKELKHKEIELNKLSLNKKNNIIETELNDNETYNNKKCLKINNNYKNIKERIILNINNGKLKLVKTDKRIPDQLYFFCNKFKNFIHSKGVGFEILNKSISISIHILIMIIFEIYFFFGYVVNIENETFIKKIGDTYNHFETVKLNAIEIEIIKKLIQNEEYIQNDLYTKYLDSKDRQKIILHNLFVKSCKMTIPFGVICFILTFVSFFNFKYIKWKSILLENITMFLVLGLFEYFFFLNVILKYEPVTNEEIKYFMVNNTFIYLSRLESINEN